jgi:hypothetical protein
VGTLINLKVEADFPLRQQHQRQFKSNTNFAVLHSQFDYSCRKLKLTYSRSPSALRLGFVGLIFPKRGAVMLPIAPAAVHNVDSCSQAGTLLGF